MNHSRSVIFTCLLAAISILTPRLDAKDKSSRPATETASPARIYTEAETAEFKILAQATLDALAAKKSGEMITKLTDLETAWDDHESALRPRNEATWTMIDKTLDKAISSLRSSHTNQAKGKAALDELLAMLAMATLR